MSGIFIKRHGEADREVLAAAKHLTFTQWTKSNIFQSMGFSFGFTWIGTEDFKPIFSDENHKIILCMLGRLYCARDDIRLDMKLPRIAEQYREKGTGALTGINGAGTLILFDGKTDSCHIVTDRLGCYPVYAAYENDLSRVAVCTHTDILAASYSASPAFDEISMASAISAGITPHPYTLYKDIHILDAGSVYSWNTDGIRKAQSYWTPQPQLDFSKTVDEYAEDLAEALKKAVKIRFGQAGGKSGILLSGGLDSRSILFAADPPRDSVMGITFCDVENYEIRTAARLARRAGAQHVILHRSRDYYIENAPRSVRISGGMWDNAHAHSTGLLNEINDLGLAYITSGNCIDKMFKGWSVDVKLKKRGFFLPDRQIPAPFDPGFGGRVIHLNNPDIARAINERMTKQYKSVNRERMNAEDRLLVEIARVYPLSVAPGLCQLSIAWNTLPYDLLPADNGLIDLFLSIPSEMKLNLELIKRTLKRISPESLEEPYANIGINLLAPRPAQAFQGMMFALARRRWRRRGIPEGSWVRWSDYMKRSELLKQVWFENRERCEELVTRLTGRNPYETPYESWSRKRSEMFFFRRALFLVLWEKYRIRRL